MNRTAVIVGIAGLVIGLLAGFLWWGMPTQRLEARLGKVQAQVSALERQLDEAQGKARQAEAGQKGLQQQVAALGADLAREREMRTRLETIVSRGRK